MRMTSASLAGEITPITGASVFVAPASGSQRVAFREGQIAGTHTAESMALDAPLEQVVDQAREGYGGNHRRIIDTDEFALSSMLAAYQVRQARRNQE